MRKLLFVSLVLFLCVTTASGQDFNCLVPGGQTLYFNVNGSNVIVTQPQDTTLPYFTQLGDLIIPSTITYGNEEYYVTAIDSFAFANCRGLTSITLPSSIVSVGKSAFNGTYDMARTYYLGSIDQWCNISFVTGQSNPVYLTGNLYINNALVTSPVISEGVREIRPFCFAGMRSLTSISFPGSLTSIGKYAFCYCENLSSLSLPSAVITIGKAAFYHCDGLRDVALSDSLEYIDDNAFRNCGLEIISIPSKVKYIGENTFINNENLVSVYFNADSCLVMGKKREDGNIYCAFGSGCTNLETITIGSNVKVIPDYAFAFCRYVSKVIIPDGVKRIGHASFQTCSSLSDITIGKGIHAIPDSAFGWCLGVQKIVLRTEIPPTVGINTFHVVYPTIAVPCSAVDVYSEHSYWGQFSIEGDFEYDVQIQSSDTIMGEVEFLVTPSCANNVAVVKANANAGYAFSQWSDGNLDNPRVVEVYSDTCFIARFVPQVSILDNTIKRDYSVFVQNESIIIGGAANSHVRVYDIVGRVIINTKCMSNSLCVNVPLAGLYLVQVDALPPRKVVVR